MSTAKGTFGIRYRFGAQVSFHFHSAMPPPITPSASAQEKPDSRAGPSQNPQPAEADEHLYDDYSTYQYQYEDEVAPGGSPRPLRPAPPPPVPSRLPGTPSAPPFEVSGPGARSRRSRLDPRYQGQGQPDRELYPVPRRSGPKNLGALREVVTYDPDREERGGVTIRDFLESATGAATLGNLDGDDLMQVMPMRLQGAAKTFYRTFMESKGLNPSSPALGSHWDEFRQALRDRFKKSTDSVTTLMHLANCRQGDKESVRAYAQRVKSMAIKLWPTLLHSPDPTNQDLADSLIFQHFQKGLRPHLLEYLSLKDIHGMDQAVIELTRKETFDQAQKERYGGQVNMISDSRGSGYSPTQVDHLQKQMADLQTTVSAYMAETTGLVREQLATAAPAYPESIHQHWSEYQAGYSPYENASHDGPCPPEPNLPVTDWSPLDMPAGHYGMVNAVEFQPRLPQYPIIRPPMPAGQAQVGPRGGCNYCGGPHMWRQCPHLGYGQTFLPSVPYQGRLPRPGAPAGHPGRPTRPTGAFPPRAMWRGQLPAGALRPHMGNDRYPAYEGQRPALNGWHRL